MKKNITTCAVIVTYNRKELLLECLEALLKQTYPLTAIYLIDNASTDGTPEFLKEKGHIDKILRPTAHPEETEKSICHQNSTYKDKSVTIHYVRMHENTGGAGGFYEGCKRGYEKGHDWLWLMDDDGFPSTTALEELMSFTKKRSDCVFNSLVLSKTGPDKLSFGLIPINKKEVIWDISEVDKKSSNGLLEGANFFNGTLIPRGIVEKIGLPKCEYFICGDEVEYHLRIQKYGFSIFTVSKSKFLHPSISENFSLWKSYYLIRNEIRNIITYKKMKFLSVLKFSFTSIARNVYRYKFQGFIYGVKAAIDAVLYRMGKRV